MKIVVITGSPRKNSTSNYLADEFIKGASENGHEIYKFDSNKANMKHYIACDSCGRGLKPCIFKDDFIELKEHRCCPIYGEAVT